MLNSRKEIMTSILVLVFGSLLLGLFSVLSGKELGWDLANYHYYNPFALLHLRYTLDWWPPSGIHQFINPTMDLFSYFMINTFSPLLTTFLLGTLHGINFWLVFTIACCYLPNTFKTLSAFFIALLGIYGPTAIVGFGSFQNDNLISLFVLSCVLLQTYFFQHYSKTHCLNLLSLIFSGIFLGMAVGLKYTAGIFLVGASISVFFITILFRLPLKTVFIFSMSLTLGLLLTSGYWMLLMWQQHHNPFFPFFNGIFHSPDFYDFNWRDLRFLPHGFLQIIFFPFYFSWNGQTADLPFKDFRFAILHILFLLTSVKYLTRLLLQKSHSPIQEEKNIALWWLFTFFITSYAAWEYFFSISRYLVALEMLAPLLIYLLLEKLIANKYGFAATICVIFYFLFYLMVPLKSIRAPWFQHDYLNVRLPSSIQHQKDGLVLVAFSAFSQNLNPRPQFYLIPFFPESFRFIGVPFQYDRFLHEAKTINYINLRIAQSKHTIYILCSDHNLFAFKNVLHYFHLKSNGECEQITSDRQRISNQKTLLCPVIKT